MQKTELSKQDLKIYQSERLHDLSDGGGFMTHKALTGKKGELFNPISDLEQVVGSFDMRLVYPAVNTDGVEQLQGAHFIISEPALAENVGFVAMAGEYYGEERKNAVSRAEAYAIATVATNMTLFGDAVKGSRFVRAYMEDDEETPKIGERYCLDDGTNSLFFRIAKVESTRRRFYDDNGNAFYKKIVSMETVSRITTQFTGASTATKNGGNAPTKIKETQAADTSQYYGIKPLFQPASKGDLTVFVPSIMQNLVPTTTVETPYIDMFPASSGVIVPLSDAPMDLGRIGSGGTFKMPVCFVPDSVKVNNGRWGIEEDLGNNTIKIVSVNDGSSYSISCIPAVYFSNAVFSATIPINASNKGQSFAPFLTPAPALGCVSISYFSLNERYFIKDDGTGALIDGKGETVGNVMTNGSVIFSLPSMPDEGSKITISWSPIDCYKIIKNQQVTQETASVKRGLLKDAYPNIKPGTVEVIVNNNTTLTDSNHDGVLQNGTFTGFVDYASGQIYLDDMKKVTKCDVSFQRYTGNATMQNFTPSADDIKIYGFTQKATAGTVQLFLPVVWRATYGTRQSFSVTTYMSL